MQPTNKTNGEKTAFRAPMMAHNWYQVSLFLSIVFSPSCQYEWDFLERSSKALNFLKFCVIFYENKPCTDDICKLNFLWNLWMAVDVRHPAIRCWKSTISLKQKKKKRKTHSMHPPHSIRKGLGDIAWRLSRIKTTEFWKSILSFHD